MLAAALEPPGEDEADAAELHLGELEPNDSQGRQALSLAEVQSGRAEAAYARLREMGSAAYETDTIEVYALSMFFTERYAEVLLLVPRSPATTKRLLCTLGALAAAWRGDAARSSELAAAASHAGPGDNEWLIGLISERLEKAQTPLQSRAWQLAREIDTAERKGDSQAIDLALMQYANDVKP